MDGRKYIPYPIHAKGECLAGLSNGFLYTTHDLNGDTRTSDEVLAQYDFDSTNEMKWKVPLASSPDPFDLLKADETSRLGIFSSGSAIGGFIVGESSEVEILVDGCMGITGTSVCGDQVAYVNNTALNCMRVDSGSGQLKPQDMRHTNLRADLCEVNNDGGVLIWNRSSGLSLVDPEIRDIRYAPNHRGYPLTVDTLQNTSSVSQGFAMQAHLTRDVVAVLDISNNLEIYDKRNLSCALFRESFAGGMDLAVVKNEVFVIDQSINGIRALSITNFEHQSELYMPRIQRIGRYYVQEQQWPKPPGSKYPFPLQPTRGDSMVPVSISRSSDSLLIHGHYAVFKADAF